MTEEGGRARPLSAGLRSLLGWLRRADSDCSLSSGGSDRTAVSFAFLHPRQYTAAAEPVALPPPGPPSDSYRRRLQQRGERRNHDRDLTLRSKYQLPSDGEVLSLPTPRRAAALVRRARSETAPRRAHVPGKRRAPPPPCGPSARRAKRPAPPPPPPPLAAVSLRDTSRPAEGRPKRDNSFFKLIFERRKRDSTDISSVKILPNISELDNQATRLLAAYRLQALEGSGFESNAGEMSSEKVACEKGEVWFCTRCLRKYDSTMVTCLNCLSKARITEGSRNRGSFVSTRSNDSAGQFHNIKNNDDRSNKDTEERKKLREMLKEMKNYVPKENKKTRYVRNEETPTLPMELSKKSKIVQKKEQSTDSNKNKPVSETTGSNIVLQNQVLVTQTTVLVDASRRDNFRISETQKETLNEKKKRTPERTKFNKEKLQQTTCTEPIKLLSLLNPESGSVFEPGHRVDPAPSTSKEVDGLEVHKSSKTIATNSPENLRETKAAPPKDINARKNENNTAKIETDVNEKINTNEDKIMRNENNLLKNNETRPLLEQYTKRRDLINQLETSIAQGDERSAADAAVKLAKLKLSCAVLSFSSNLVAQKDPTTSKTQEAAVAPADEKNGAILQNAYDLNRPTSSKQQGHNLRSKESQSVCSKDPGKPHALTTSAKEEDSSEEVTIQVWVEDRWSSRGPLGLRVRRGARLRALRATAHAALGVQPRLQRWVVARTLATDDEAPLQALAGPHLDAPFYLCLVDPGPNSELATESNNEKKTDTLKTEEAHPVYSELIELERQALVPNVDAFECGVCLEQCGAGEGAVLRECVHAFCRACLRGAALLGEGGAASCPASGCAAALTEREVRALLPPADYERWLARGLAVAESGAPSAFHCRTVDCAGWALAEPGARRFLCPVCGADNCLACQAIHERESCQQYKERLNELNARSSESSPDAGTLALLDALIEKGEALRCPECRALITKKWGCDWVRCLACKTEICWVTRGRRWGPAGRGDTSAGCRCGVDGQRCHPTCGYCH